MHPAAVASIRRLARPTAYARPVLAPLPPSELESVARLTELADYVVPFGIRVAAELRLADQLADGPRSAEELAAASGAQRPLAAAAAAGAGLQGHLFRGGTRPLRARAI